MEDLEKNSIKEFNEWAKTYDRKSIHYYIFYFTNKKVVRLLNPKEGSTVLDAGFGTGILLEQLLAIKRNLRLSGLDISEGMYKKAEAKFSGNPAVKLALGSASKIPFEDNSFDYVTCIHSLHHHPNTEQSLREMNRVLKPGAKAVVVDLSLDGFLRKMVSKRENAANQEGKVCRYTKMQMKGLFEKAGFNNIKQKYLWHFSLITIGEKKA